MASLVECYGVSGVVVFWGVGRNPCHLDTDAATPTGVASLPEGRQMYTFPTPIAYRGNPRMSTRGNPRTGRAILSSSMTFLEVLLDTRRIGVVGAWWKFFGGRSSSESSPFSSILHCRHFSFPFLLRFF